MQSSLLRPADKQDPAGSSLPTSGVLRKAPNCAAVPGLGDHAPAHLAEPVFVPGVATVGGELKIKAQGHSRGRRNLGRGLKVWSPHFSNPLCQAMKYNQ